MVLDVNRSPDIRVGEGVGYDADSVGKGKIIVDFLALLPPPAAGENIAKVLTLYDLLLPDAGYGFLGNPIADLPVILRHSDYPHFDF